MSANINKDWYYIAGLFDGDGHASFGFYHSGRKTKDGTKKRYPRLTARITNTNRDVLVWIQKFLNIGSVSSAGNLRNNGLSKLPCYYWIAHTAQARQFLKKIAPILKIKKRKVLDLIKKDKLLVKARK